MALLPPVTLHWRLKTSASVSRTWALFSDTDRFNRVAGREDRYTERPLPNGQVERTGSMRIVGVKLRWQESPFEWREREGFSVRRIFHGGPAAEYILRVELTPLAEGGTEISYRVDVHPRFAATRPAVIADARLFTKPSLNKALNRAIDVLDGRRALFDDPAPPLPRKIDSRLSAGLAQLRSKDVAKHLGALIRSAPLVAQRELAPLKLAKRWKLAESEVLVGFMDAVSGGVLTLSWELRCPSCRVSKAQAPRLTAGPQDVHCPSCNLPFDGSLPDNLIAAFRPDPSIRTLDIPVRCIGSPAKTPHLLAQHIIVPRQGNVVEAALLPGAYRIRTFPATTTVSLQVRPDVVTHDAAVHLHGGQLTPGLLRLGAGRIRLHVRTTDDRRVTLLVERVSFDKYTLTAGRLLEFDDARRAIPPDLLHPDLSIELKRGVVLAAKIERGGAEASERLERALQTWKPTSLLCRDGVVTALFDDATRALSAASLLDGAYHLGAAMAAGTVVVKHQAGPSEPCGGLAERCLRLASAAPGGAVLVPFDAVDDVQLAQILQSDGVTSDRLDLADRAAALQVHLAHPARTSPPLQAGGPAQKVESGTVIDGRYSLVERLGDGGFGTAWLASDPAGAEVVVKLLHPRLASDPVQVQRFFNEGRLVMGLRSDHCARVLDYGRGRGGHLYLAMERLRGEELWQRMRREGCLPPGLVVHIASDVLRGLEDAHACGLIHRDIKPSNIFLCEDPDRAHPLGFPTAKLIDFGVARSMESADPRLTTDGHAVGTPHYMAPEQVECRTIDGRTDLFALGCMLYECLSGKLPYKGDSTMALLLARIRDDPTPLHTVMPYALPSPFSAVIMA
ncbi:MAG: serine/threonine protein kinase, partial [Myxococcales bacterium]|nr:serine/threonine protein kinase [Myxococcales bacterium]